VALALALVAVEAIQIADQVTADQAADKADAGTRPDYAQQGIFDPHHTGQKGHKTLRNQERSRKHWTQLAGRRAVNHRAHQLQKEKQDRRKKVKEIVKNHQQLVQFGDDFKRKAISQAKKTKQTLEQTLEQLHKRHLSEQRNFWNSKEEALNRATQDLKKFYKDMAKHDKDEKNAKDREDRKSARADELIQNWNKRNRTRENRDLDRETNAAKRAGERSDDHLRNIDYVEKRKRDQGKQLVDQARQRRDQLAHELWQALSNEHERKLQKTEEKAEEKAEENAETLEKNASKAEKLEKNLENEKHTVAINEQDLWDASLKDQKDKQQEVQDMFAQFQEKLQQKKQKAADIIGNKESRVEMERFAQDMWKDFQNDQEKLRNETIDMWKGVQSKVAPKVPSALVGLRNLPEKVPNKPKTELKHVLVDGKKVFQLSQQQQTIADHVMAAMEQQRKARAMFRDFTSSQDAMKKQAQELFNKFGFKLPNLAAVPMVK